MILRKIVLLVFLLVPLTSFLVFPAPQEDSSTTNIDAQSVQDTTGTQVTGSPEQKKDAAAVTGTQQTFYTIMEMGGNIGYGIVLVLIVGMFFLVFEFINRVKDKKNSKELANLDFSKYELVQIEQKITSNASTSSIGRLLFRLMEVYQETKSSDRFNDEIIKFKQVLVETFDTFKNRMIFLSDTCGALGLLGTVWGMYRTFFGGVLEPQLILTGMGIALITTLQGLIASLILNAGTTEIISSFNKNQDLLTEKSYEFLLKIIAEEKLHKSEERERNFIIYQTPPTGIPITGDKVISSEELLESQTILNRPTATQVLQPGAETPPIRKEVIIYPEQIEIVSGNDQMDMVGSNLKPLVVKVMDEINNSLSKKKVTFTVVTGQATFSEGKETYETYTDENGIASTGVKLGNKSGKITISAQVDGKSGRILSTYFKLEALPGEPANLEYISGNYQNAPVRSTLKYPLKIQVTDAFGNPIKDFKATFKILEGGGRFPSSKNSVFEGVTDSDGILAISYILGEIPGINTISVNSKLETKEHFQVFGQPRSEGEK